MDNLHYWKGRKFITGYQSMGMFDYFEYGVTCPKCNMVHSTLQTKDGICNFRRYLSVNGTLMFKDNDEGKAKPSDYTGHMDVYTHCECSDPPVWIELRLVFVDGKIVAERKHSGRGFWDGD